MTTKTDTPVKVNLKEPDMFDVVIYNDDSTPMDFVTGILTEIFNKSNAEAVQIMLKIHHNSSAVAGTYTYEIAEQKGVDATNVARDNGYPLMIRINSS